MAEEPRPKLEKGNFWLEEKPESTAEYLRRPFDLLGASFWQSCYVSPRMAEVSGILMPTMVGVEYPHGLTNSYRSRQELNDFRQAMKTIAESDPSKCENLIAHGESLSEEGVHPILGGSKMVNSLEELHDLLVDIYIHQHTFPYFFLEFSSAEQSHDLLKRAEALRSVTDFYEIYEKHMLPLASAELQSNGKPPEAIKAVTIRELLNSDFSSIGERLAEIQADKYFVYSTAGGQERVGYQADPTELINELSTGSKLGDKTPERLRENW